MIDPTNDVALRSWVASATGHLDFPIQNLPLGIVALPDGASTAAVAIGDMVLDLGRALAAGAFEGEARIAAETATSAPALNAFLALGHRSRGALRNRLSVLLREGAPERASIEACLVPSADCVPQLPCVIGDYTDFYVGIHHATNVGKLLRPDNPLLPNYKYLPIGYHGRASSIRSSGVRVYRPHGQTKAPGSTVPSVGPSQRLDYELEIGVWIGSGNAPGRAIPLADAAKHIGGFCLLNDWSARDIQAWEYQPLGPFLAKNFATTVSCWIISPEALAPFRIPQPRRPMSDPEPLPYLIDEADRTTGAFDIQLEVSIRSEEMRLAGMPPFPIGRSNTE